MAFERKNQKLISAVGFYQRLFKHFFIAISLVLLSISFGAAGYHFIEGLSWVDSVYNASMILTGMGPVTVLQKNAGKIFASLYAIYGGIILLAVTGIVLAPVAHRLLHLFNLKEDEEES